MPAREPLKGIELIDCAKANASQGIATAAYQCGYGEDETFFMEAVRSACKEIGINIEKLGDLITEEQMAREIKLIDLAPNTPSEL